MSHTSGPWEILWLSDGSCDIDGPNDELICTMQPIATLAKEHVANARLIAQAPCMLDALTKFVAFHDADHDQMSGWDVQRLYDAAIVSAKEAINKATGAQEDGQ